MKTNSATVSLLFFTKTYKISLFKQITPLFSAFFSNNRKLINYVLASLAIGAIFLGSFIAFLTQLAEYGW